MKPPGESALDTDSGVPIEGKDPGSGLSEFTSSLMKNEKNQLHLVMRKN